MYGPLDFIGYRRGTKGVPFSGFRVWGLRFRVEGAVKKRVVYIWGLSQNQGPLLSSRRGLGLFVRSPSINDRNRPTPKFGEPLCVHA